MDRVLISTLVDMFVFLEFSGEKVLNLDAAVSAMESAATSLKSLDPDARRRFISVAREIAGEYRDADQRAFIHDLGKNLGLED